MKISEITSRPNVPVGVINQQGIRYEILLPDADDDHIQKRLLETGEPYELDILQSMGRKIGKGDLVLDVGAHVGNHAMYLASVVRARVLAFEPNAHLSSAMNDSLVRNNLQDLVTVQTIGLGQKKTFAHFDKSIPADPGNQTLELGQGDIEVVSLDSLGIEAAIRMIKIDVKGMELAVLEGGRECIERDRPILYIECRDGTSFRKVLNWAQHHRYTYWKTFNVVPMHLFLAAETVTLDQWIDHVSAQNLSGEHPVIAKLKQSRELESKALAQLNRLESAREIESLDQRSIDLINEALHENLVAQTEILDHRSTETKEKLDEARAYARELENRLLAVLDSKTWKVMEPVRSVLRLLKGRDKPPPFKARLFDSEDLTANGGQSAQSNLDRTHADSLAPRPHQVSQSPDQLEVIANELELERVRLTSELQRISTSSSYLLGRSIIATLKLDLAGATRFAKDLLRRRSIVVEKPKRFRHRDFRPDSLVEILRLNPEMNFRRGLTVLVIGQPLQSGSLNQICLNRADAEASTLRYAGCDLLVNANGLKEEIEWGNLFQPDDIALNKFFAKLLLICRANSMRCHVIAEDTRVFPLLSKFERHVMTHSTESDYLASRENR